MPVGTEAGRAGSARWRSTSCASSGLRQAGRPGYRLRRCPVRLPRWACPQGWAVPAGGSMGRAASPMDGMAGPDGELFDRGLPSVGRGGGNLLTPAFAFTRETRQGGLLSFWSQTDAVVGPRAGVGLDGDVRTTMVGTDYAKGPSTRWASSSSRTCAAIRLALGDQDLRLAQVADNLLRGITLSGHDDPL